MKQQQLNLAIYDKRKGITTTLFVEKIAESKFRLLENDFFDCRLNLGTEFEARANQEGKYEIVSITKDSDFITRRFFLFPQFKESEYRLLGDEIVKHGGYWEVGFGGIAIINLPKEAELAIDEIFKVFNFSPVEIKE